ncbi:E3 ubiquitin-protein ligase MIB1 [Spatholobus suberectus]|nr:E3 ubiquitin-protein ligase MIB1 [Spatholobus suberectus]
MPPSYLPLRWESTGEQWWYASPIDCAAANGHYDLVVELLHLDTNLLIKLTSLRRIRRLETVWDDEAHFEDVAKCRSQVAGKLMSECETRGGQNSLIRAGYGGWLLYTAASAGDVDFARELLGRCPALVFGEGEYGVTDILYAAARSNNSEVFEFLLRSALSPSGGKEMDEAYGRDMMNRAVHAAARGGNWEMLKQLVGDASGVLGFRDAQGCTVLHTAAGRGQVEVVRNLLASFDVVNLTDDQGNTALHGASYGGHLPVVEILILSSPSLALLTNHYGDTFLHMAVAGFRSPGFRRMDKHTELMKQLVREKIVTLQDIINVKNNDGRTALHVSVIDNIQCELVELLMSVPSIDLNICDVDGMTPLDLLKQRSRSASSDILIKRMISAGGISNRQDAVTGNTLCTHHKAHVIGGSPGTSFRIPDAEIFLYTGIENSSDANYDQASVESYSCSNELSNSDSANSPRNKKSSSVNYAVRRSKFRLPWPRRETKAAASEIEDDDSVDPFSSSRNLEEFPIPLRQRYSQPCSLPNNKRTQSMRTSLPSPSSKVKFTAGLMQGVIQLKPHPAPSTPSPFQELSVATLSSIKKQKGADIMGPSCSNRSIDDGTLLLNYKQCSFNKKLMNGYFSFGAQDPAVEDSDSCAKSNRSYKRLSSLVA